MKYIDIAFDLDGVLVDVFPVFDHIIWDEYESIRIPTGAFYVQTDPFLDDKTIAECVDRAMFRINDIMILPGATELLETLYHLSGEPVKIITARTPETHANATHKFISERLCRVPYDLTLVAGNSKVPFARRYNFMVEDRRKTAREFVDADKKVYLIDYDYNKMEDHPLIKRISGVHELLPYAKEFVKEI